MSDVPSRGAGDAVHAEANYLRRRSAVGRTKARLGSGPGVPEDERLAVLDQADLEVSGSDPGTEAE